MDKKKKETVSEDLINITMSSSQKPRDYSYNPAGEDYKISLEEDGYYKITLNGETIIHTKVSEKLLNDLKLWNLIPADAPKEEEQKAIEAYLIRAAKEFISKELHKKKQDGRGKIDIPGIEDEF
ncbi:MAG TPA: hypothetical protein P5509_04235 [Bacteroidales bacterium]|mgnify:CR=1 FL=1|nr:hypothetical protein [Bacteroidales bacterium]